MILVSTQNYPPQQSGVQNIMENIARHATEQGHSVHVLAYGGRGARTYDRHLNAPWKIERFIGPRALRRMMKTLRLRHICRQGKPLALFVDYWKGLEALQGMSLDFPVVCWGHGTDLPMPHARKSDRICNALSLADVLICVSRSVYERALPSLPEDLSVEIVHPPTPVPKEPTTEDTIFARDVWGEAWPRLVVFCVLVDWKGIDQAIRAIAILKNRFPNVRYAVAGAGTYLSRLKQIVAENNLADNVHFLGWVDGGRKTALLRSADVFLQPGRAVSLPGRSIKDQFEGFGISYVEAALAGLPAISGNQGGAVEAVVDGETGLVVDGENVDEIVKALSQILKDKELYASMSQKAKATAEKRLWPSQIAHILSLARLPPAA